ncbi:hypothetical protein DL767_009054 [Monosporascus sp. MG133]|nr:hypothetical protein DL767_009054 [Monosporascus sp. MG133]
MEPESFDFVIVGGGIAGLVLAARLSEDANTQVLVIEAGEDRTTDPRVNIPAMWPTLLGTSADWNFKTVPQEGLGHREISLPQGRLLGGSSALNGLTFSATSKANIDAWESLGNPGWDWSSFSESVKKSYTLPSQGPRTKGPIQLSVPEEDSEWLQVWRKTLATLGYPTSADSFSGEFYGALTVTDAIDPIMKQRSFAGNAYLEPAKARSNLTIWTQTVAERILFDQSEEIVATGVHCSAAGETKTVRARKEVLITAGAINSPKLLELSGVGNAKLLQSLGIDVVIDSPQVGENLQNHPLCTLSFEVREQPGFETIDNLSRQNPNAIAAAMEAYSKQSGPFSRSGSNLAAQLPLPEAKTEGGKQELKRLLHSLGSEIPHKPKSFTEAHKSFVHSVLTSPTEASGCYTAIPGFAAATGDGLIAPVPPGQESYLSIALLLAHPLSRGSVHIRSPSPSSPDLAIDPRYLTEPLDMEVFARHLQFVETIAMTDPLASQLRLDGKRSPAAPPAGAFADLNVAKDYIRNTAVGAHHFTSTCAMMPPELGGVVDAQLRVYGCQNLRVCDASIIPITPRTNPQATVYGVAEHAAQIIKSGLRRLETT